MPASSVALNSRVLEQRAFVSLVADLVRQYRIQAAQAQHANANAAQRSHLVAAETYSDAIRSTQFLVAAGERMKQVPSRTELFAVAHEVLATLLGTESFAIFERTASGLSLVASAGIAAKVAISHNERQFQLCAAGEPNTADAAQDKQGFPICVPLEYGNTVVGLLAIYELLPQKTGLSRSDCELLSFLKIALGAGLVVFTPSRSIEVVRED